MKTLLHILLLFFSFSVYTQTYTGTIIRVIDGDTFIFQTNEGSMKIRLQGIDAPESNQDFGKESTTFLNQYVNKTASIIYKGTDKYDRILAYLVIQNININRLIIRKGLAWHYNYFSSDTSFANAQKLAKVDKTGLWAYPNPTAPWDWRKYKK